MHCHFAAALHIPYPFRMRSFAWISMIPEEVTDLMCHPAYIDQFLYETTSYSWKRMKELEILCSEEAAALLQRYQIQLCTYKEV